MVSRLWKWHDVLEMGRDEGGGGDGGEGGG